MTLATVEYEGHKFFMRNETEVERMRVDTFATKEPETLRWISDMPRAALFVDVGANIGVYSCYAAARGLNVVAVEPVKATYDILQANTAQFDTRVTCYRAAVAANNAEHVLCVPQECGADPAAAGAHLLDARLLGSQAVSGALERVRVVSLAELTVHQAYFSDMFVKIDIDGAEWGAVLSGCNTWRCVSGALIEITLADVPVSAFDAHLRQYGLLPDDKYNATLPHSSERRCRDHINVVNRVYSRA